MDNKQAIEILKDVVMEHNSWNSGISFWDLDSAIHKAIASLEAWDKIIENINTKYGHILKATKYGNEDAEQQSFSYSNVFMYEVSDILDDILYDIEEIKKEIEE